MAAQVPVQLLVPDVSFEYVYKVMPVAEARYVPNVGWVPSVSAGIIACVDVAAGTGDGAVATGAAGAGVGCCVIDHQYHPPKSTMRMTIAHMRVDLFICVDEWIICLYMIPDCR